MTYIIMNCFNFRETRTIVLASKDYTESGLLTTIMAELIEEKTDIKVDKKMYIGTTDILHKSLIKGEIDGYVEYTGTSYLTVFKQQDNIDDLYKFVKDEYDKIGITTFEPLGINNTFVIIQNNDTYNKYGIQTISDIRRYQENLTLTSYAEFIERDDGLKSLLNNYNLKFKEVKQLERSLGYKALSENKVDLMISFSTEPAIFKYDFKEVIDDKELFLRYDAVPIIKTSTLDKYPDLIECLKLLESRFDNKTMARLNNEVENEKKSEVDVARNWLKEEGLID